MKRHIARCSIILRRIQFFLAIVFLATSFSRTALADHLSAVAESQREAIREFPDLAVKGSVFNSTFVNRYNQLKATNPAYFEADNWPVRLADECAGKVVSNQDPIPQILGFVIFGFIVVIAFVGLFSLLQGGIRRVPRNLWKILKLIFRLTWLVLRIPLFIIRTLFIILGSLFGLICDVVGLGPIRRMFAGSADDRDHWDSGSSTEQTWGVRSSGWRIRTAFSSTQYRAIGWFPDGVRLDTIITANSQQQAKHMARSMFPSIKDISVTREPHQK